jgi:hypothetical protein
MGESFTPLPAKTGPIVVNIGDMLSEIHFQFSSILTDMGVVAWSDDVGVGGEVPFLILGFMIFSLDAISRNFLLGEQMLTLPFTKRLKSKFHRVRAKDVGKSPSRYSIAYFNQSRKDFVLQGPKKK